MRFFGKREGHYMDLGVSFWYYVDRSITHIPTTHMTLEACIAHAIHSDLDILEVLPEVHDLPVDHLESYIERFVVEVQESLYQVISQKGDPYLKSGDAAGLCATCLDSGVSLPPPMLLKMCQTIVQLNTIEARFILDTEDGKSLYYLKVALS
jgi:hypothetical protein